MISILLAAMVAFAAPTKSVSKTVPSSAIPERREFPLNPEINACQDFHGHVCSKVEASFKLRPDRSMHLFSFSDSNERLLEVKKKFMRELHLNKNLDLRTSQIRDFYLSCMNGPERARDEKTFVTRIAGDLKKITTAEQLLLYAYNHTPQGLNEMIRTGAVANPDDPKKIDAMVAGRFMLLPDHKYYEQADLMKAYEALLVTFYRSAYPGLKKSIAVKKAQAVIKLQRDFAKIYPSNAVRHQRWSENRTTSQAEILTKYPLLKLDILFGKMPKDILVRNSIPEALEFMNADLSTRPIEVWKDIYLLKAIDDVMDDAYQKYFKANFRFHKKFFGGPEKRSDRQERCTSESTAYFMKELDAALVDKVFPKFDETKINEVATRIRQSILDGLNTTSWLSREGKKEALAKIKNARLQLVKPHSDREWDFIPMRKYSPNHYVQNLQLYSEASWEKTLKELSEPANRDAWGMGPLTVNAYYSPGENKFVLPIGILQYPFFDQNASVIENLGAVGAVIGHELGHSIDDSGSKYDSSGRLKQWMTTKDLVEFNLRGQKMIDQFNNADHDGKLTLGENVADLVGLTFAYNAAFPKDVGSTEDKQKFFIAYARNWCSVIRPDFVKLLKKTDPHALASARINEQVKHQPGFSKAFQCKEGDPMTLPEKDRVQIW